MKPLSEIYAKYTSAQPGAGDKGTVHSYIEVYSDVLEPYRKCKNVLEIGILNGQSLRMWEEYFGDAAVFGLDISDTYLKAIIAEGTHRIAIFNARDVAAVAKEYAGIKFDVIIEDASHALEDQLAIYAIFKDYLAPDGLYIVEDVANIDQVRSQFLAIDKEKIVSVVDRRLVKHRYDDVLVLIGGIQNRPHPALAPWVDEFVTEHAKFPKSSFAYIDNMFNHLSAVPSDMRAHMPRLYYLAVQCERIVEMGVWDCTSTWALLAGKPKWMRSYDIVRLANVDDVERITKGSGIDFAFVKESTLDTTIEECDLLFIDTYHSYDQLTAELARHAHKVKKWLVFHDTTTFGNHDQTPGGGIGNTGRGLWPAIEEFLASHPEWVLLDRYTDCNGLTVLRRTI